MFRRIGVDADEDILVLPRHRDHLIGPRDADVDAEQLQFGEVDRDLVETDRPADARQPAVALIDQVVPTCIMIGMSSSQHFA